MQNNILSVLIEAGAITEERAKILEGVSNPSSIYGLNRDAGVEQLDNSDFLITDEELRFLVKIENLLTKEIPEAERDTALPLLMVILVRLLEFSKDPNEDKMAALEDVISSYQVTKKEMNTFIYQTLQEQIDLYVARYKRNILKRILKK